MSEINTRKPMILNQKLKRLFLLALLAGSLTGCFDRRRAVAFGTFVIPDGRFHQEAFAAALSARFPRDSPVEDLQRYVASVRGHCNERGPDAIWCEIPLRGAICWAEIAGIKVTHGEGRIVNVETIIGGLSC